MASTVASDTWAHCTLGELFRIKHGFAFRGEFFAKGGPYILLTPGNFNAEGGLKSRGESDKYYVGPVPPDYVLQRGDMLVVMTDLTQEAPILGSPAFIPEDHKYLHNQRLGKIVEWDSERIHLPYVYYLLNHGSLRAQIRASASGATVRHTSPERIYAVQTAIPP